MPCQTIERASVYDRQGGRHEKPLGTVAIAAALRSPRTDLGSGLSHHKQGPGRRALQEMHMTAYRKAAAARHRTKDQTWIEQVTIRRCSPWSAACGDGERRQHAGNGAGLPSPAQRRDAHGGLDCRREFPVSRADFKPGHCLGVNIPRRMTVRNAREDGRRHKADKEGRTGRAARGAGASGLGLRPSGVGAADRRGGGDDGPALRESAGRDRTWAGGQDAGRPCGDVTTGPFQPPDRPGRGYFPSPASRPRQDRFSARTTVRSIDSAHLGSAGNALSHQVAVEHVVLLPIRSSRKRPSEKEPTQSPHRASPEARIEEVHT